MKPEIVVMFDNQLNTSAEDEETFKNPKHPTAAEKTQHHLRDVSSGVLSLSGCHSNQFWANDKGKPRLDQAGPNVTESPCGPMRQMLDKWTWMLPVMEPQDVSLVWSTTEENHNPQDNQP
ncbi:hypothetical protein WICPIJ_003951 [Wickerhamomyces pijperi]|uniref:Uncharacterized protein n=1 Tax=Wickerhamomyces pijperi TaxID=599730 RepID=A0A9P8Q8X7_WICPI|nr:hypothetical protein WICPIJ_003951 [Wickerhamomyces pijperi]